MTNLFGNPPPQNKQNPNQGKINNLFGNPNQEKKKEGIKF